MIRIFKKKNYFSSTILRSNDILYCDCAGDTLRESGNLGNSQCWPHGGQARTAGLCLGRCWLEVPRHALLGSGVTHDLRERAVVGILSLLSLWLLYAPVEHAQSSSARWATGRGYCPGGEATVDHRAWPRKQIQTCALKKHVHSERERALLLACRGVYRRNMVERGHDGSPSVRLFCLFIF